MSAFMLSDAHIDYMVTAARLYRVGGADFSDGRELLTQLLARECAKSVRYRYPRNADEMAPDPETIAPRAPAAMFHVEPVKVLKAVRCYEYQSCEHPDWETSQAAQFCRNLTAAAIANLPGYEEAPWGIEDAQEVA